MNHEICRAALVSNAPRGLGLRGGGAIKLVKQLREYVTVSRMAYLLMNGEDLHIVEVLSQLLIDAVGEQLTGIELVRSDLDHGAFALSRVRSVHSG